MIWRYRTSLGAPVPAEETTGSVRDQHDSSITQLSDNWSSYSGFLADVQGVAVRVHTQLHRI